jgi:hypothetical protein
LNTSRKKIITFFQPDFHPFPFAITEITGHIKSLIYNEERGVGGMGNELVQYQETHCEYLTSNTRHGTKT